MSHPEIEVDLRPNVGKRWPWEGRLFPLASMDDRVIRHFVTRDEDLWAMAERDPDDAARPAIAERIFFRRNQPRLGEPLYRSPENAKLDRQNMYCGRGTGHLGTGLYFFGTLRAAVDSKRLYDASGEELRRLVSEIYTRVGTSSTRGTSGTSGTRARRRATGVGKARRRTGARGSRPSLPCPRGRRPAVRAGSTPPSARPSAAAAERGALGSHRPSLRRP